MFKWINFFKRKDVKSGFMCKVDFEYELGEASGGVIIYPTVEDCKEKRKCTDECGLVEVEITLKKIVSKGTL